VVWLPKSVARAGLERARGRERREGGSEGVKRDVPDV
jgi:hypothetical protein